MADPLTLSTLTPTAPAEEVRRPQLVLTILCHPDLGRVGERAVLVDLRTLGRVGLARGAPEFRQPSGLAHPRPLEDPHLSRQPLELRQVDAVDGVELRPSPAGSAVVVDGALLDSSRLLSSEVLDHGVVIELGGRVTLLLHREPPPVEGPRSSCAELVGESHRFQAVRRAIAQVAEHPIPVLLRGETGTGKEVVARAIAEASPFRTPFVSVNLGAIPTSVAASELFGAAKGAFTGAVPSEGYFRRAEGGTLFLDEIGQTPYEVQAHLLRALDLGEVQPLGERSTFRVKVRVIAATDSDLERGIARGTFMDALLHRLSFHIFIPPLRERLDDLGRLLVHFLRGELAALGDGRRLEARPLEEPAWLPAPLVARLARWRWPGNVGELRNGARQLALASRGRSEASLDPQLLRRMEARDEPSVASASEPAPVDGRPPGPLDPEALGVVLREEGRNFSQAARRLGVSRTTLLKRAKELGLYRGPDEVSDEELLALSRETDGDLDRMAERLRQSRRGLELRLAKLKRRATQ